MTKLHKPISRVANTTLDGSFGVDRNRRIVITLIPGSEHNDTPDLFELRPQGTQRPERIAVMDVYRLAMRYRVNREVLEKARIKKDRLISRRASARLDSAERRLKERAKKDCENKGCAVPPRLNKRQSNNCKGCGCETHPSCDYCGECLCEEESV